MGDDTVLISKSYLEELEKKAKRCDTKDKKDLDRLNNYIQTHKPKSTERYARWADRHREEYNARRRERYRLKKEAEKEKAHMTTS